MSPAEHYLNLLVSPSGIEQVLAETPKEFAELLEIHHSIRNIREPKEEGKE